MEREQLTLRLPEELKEALQKEAQKKGISFNSLVVLIIRQATSRENFQNLEYIE